MVKLRVFRGDTKKIKTDDLLHMHDQTHDIQFQREFGCQNPRFDHDAIVHEIERRKIVHTSPFKCGVLEPRRGSLTAGQQRRRKGKISRKPRKEQKKRRSIRPGKLSRSEKRQLRRIERIRYKRGIR